MINIEIPMPILLIISGLILVVIIASIAYAIYKDKKVDEEEIDELIDDIAKAKPREKLINEQIEVPITASEEEEKKVKEIELEEKKTKKMEEKVEKPAKKEKLDLESMLVDMKKNLDSKEESIDKFEQDQEEKAIISYQELLDSMKQEGFEDEVKKHEEEQEKTFEEITQEKVDKFLEEAEKKKSKKFKNTEFISPIFGKMEADIEYPTIKAYNEEEFKHVRKANKKDIEKDKQNMEDINKEIDTIKVEKNKNIEFLNALKEFRNNL